MKNLLLCTALIFFIATCAFSQPANNNCANAISLSLETTCTANVNSLTGQTLSGATVEGTGVTSSCGTAGSQDVWYKFVATSVKPTIAISNKGSSWGTGMRMSLLTGTCGSFSEVSGGCVSNPTSFTPSANLTLGSTYYIRIYKNNTTNPTGSNWGFDICITGAKQSRANEVFKETIIDNGTINKPWEITYGPDDYLWITGNTDYKAYRMDPSTGTKTTILDISQGSATTELTSAEHTTFNVKFASTQNPWPQGGFAGLAIHPEFNSGKRYVYISYVNQYINQVTNQGSFFKSSIVRFTYDPVSGKLKSPVALCDTLPGSGDHNSQRLIIVPVNGVNYLFMAVGDMGAGQLASYMRSNHAQDSNYYEGKILRFNLEEDGDADDYDKWIPNDNPYNHTKQSAVWAIGMRNNQGFAYNPSTGVLYGSSHGAYSDDEINVIERYKNYGHPLVEGYAADGNYNGTTNQPSNTSVTAGETYATNSGISSLEPIGDEAANAAAINASGFAPYKDPLFAAYPSGGTGYPTATKTVSAIWSASSKPGNGAWPSEAWSGLDVYDNSVIPGWRNSLLAAGMKWGRVLRFKLDAAGTSIVPTNGSDTVIYWQGPNGYRDIAFGPNGKDIYVSIDRNNASGPAGNAPRAVVAGCNKCIIKYTFLGYADNRGKSTIPSFLSVASGIDGSFQTANKVVINTASGNNNLWVPITDTNSNIVAEINARGQNLDTVTTTLFTRTGSSRISGTKRYLNRNMTIKPQQQPTDSVWIRLYISKTEFDQFVNDGGMGDIAALKIVKNEDSATTNIATPAALTNTTVAESFNSDSYVLQGTIGSFSSFYFSNSAFTLPLSLLSFTGKLENNSVAILKWKTENEINTSHFELERSIDGNSFGVIGTVTAKSINSSDTHFDYSYTDAEAASQQSLILYYRLKMVDADGNYKYSDVVTITLKAVTRIIVAPNPTKGKVNVKLLAAVSEKVNWKLIDNTGRIVMQSTMQLRAGDNTWPIDMSGLTAGPYYLTVTGASIDQQVKLRKL